MKHQNICILGGSGFVGTAIATMLAGRGRALRVPTRRRERARHLLVLPTIDLVEANIHDPATLERLLSGMDAVINLVGVLHDGKNKEAFRAAHVELAAKVVAACKAAGVPRLLHMSGLKAAPDGPSDYLKTKGEAEAVVRASGLDWTIFQPSVIFGPGDSFLNRFASLIRFAPFLPLGRADARMQPVFVEDVARVFADCLDQPTATHKTYQVCGPESYSLSTIVEYVGEVTGHSRPIIALGGGLAKLQATLLEFAPGKPLTRDNLKSLSVDSVCDCDFESQFGFAPTPMTAVAPEFLQRRSPRSKYDRFRHFAGRRAASR